MGLADRNYGVAHLPYCTCVDCTEQRLIDAGLRMPKLDKQKIVNNVDFVLKYDDRREKRLRATIALNPIIRKKPMRNRLWQWITRRSDNA